MVSRSDGSGVALVRTAEGPEVQWTIEPENRGKVESIAFQ
jgi:hypothetical protein